MFFLKGVELHRRPITLLRDELIEVYTPVSLLEEETFLGKIVYTTQ